MPLDNKLDRQLRVGAVSRKYSIGIGAIPRIRTLTYTYRSSEWVRGDLITYVNFRIAMIWMRALRMPWRQGREGAASATKAQGRNSGG
jgi:hypothetical protein